MVGKLIEGGDMHGELIVGGDRFEEGFGIFLVDITWVMIWSSST